MRLIKQLLLFSLAVSAISCSDFYDTNTRQGTCISYFQEEELFLPELNNQIYYGFGFRGGIDGKRLRVYTDRKIYLDSLIFLDGAIGTTLTIPKKGVDVVCVEIDNNKCLLQMNNKYSIISINYSDSLKTTYIDFRNSPVTEW